MSPLDSDLKAANKAADILIAEALRLREQRDELLASTENVERLIASWLREHPLTTISCNFAAALLRDALHPTGKS